MHWLVEGSIYAYGPQTQLLPERELGDAQELHSLLLGPEQVAHEESQLGQEIGESSRYVPMGQVQLLFDCRFKGVGQALQLLELPEHPSQVWSQAEHEPEASKNVFKGQTQNPLDLVMGVLQVRQSFGKPALQVRHVGSQLTQPIPSKYCPLGQVPQAWTTAKNWVPGAHPQV